MNKHYKTGYTEAVLDLKKAYFKLNKKPLCYVDLYEKGIYRNALKDLMIELKLMDRDENSY